MGGSIAWYGHARVKHELIELLRTLPLVPVYILRRHPDVDGEEACFVRLVQWYPRQREQVTYLDWSRFAAFPFIAFPLDTSCDVRIKAFADLGIKAKLVR